MHMRRVVPSCLLAFLFLFGCEENESKVAKPDPQELTREAIGYYCNMIVADHEGPKAQIYLSGQDEPIWFSSVRDAIAFTLLPEEPKNVSAIYVNDMTRATWSAPEQDTWIDAAKAHYVIHSDRRGGMGAREAVPFGDIASAESFKDRHGGVIVSLSDIPSDYILSAEPEAAQHQHGMDETTPAQDHMHQSSHDHDN